jgi:hypothetical protein
MIDTDAEAAAMRFMDNLHNGAFSKDSIKNTAKGYSIEKQERNSRAVNEFTNTHYFKDVVMRLR